jgi:heme O synthase-like polyprenyltransferase
MPDVIRLCIGIVIALFLFSSIVMEFKKPQKDMFLFSIEVLSLLGVLLLIKEFLINHIT